MNTNITDAIDVRSQLARVPVAQLVEMVLTGTKEHNDYVHKADVWRTTVGRLRDVIRPLADALAELEQDASDAAEVGGYVPVDDEWATITVPVKDVRAAAVAMDATPTAHDAQFKDAVSAARILWKAMLELEKQGNATAAKAMTEARQFDPYL
jgi:hypothetical protein